MDRFIQKIPTFDHKRKLSDISSTSSRKKIALKDGKKCEQMYLDLGQKFGRTKNCSICGMLLVITDLEDDRRHSKFCKEVKY